MAFSVPSFPLPVQIYTGPYLTRLLRLGTLANLAPGRRSYPYLDDLGPGVTSPLSVATVLLVPKLTDIRDSQCGGPADLVQFPSGSGRWYIVQNVDDVAKGFSNEFRTAVIVKVSQFLDPIEFAGLFWPVPIP